MAEAELEAMLAPYGTVISTRILRDGNHQPRGVGFARMDAKDKCDIIISAFNGKVILGSKEPLLVKFADGGNKKKTPNRNGSGSTWKDYNSLPSSAGDHPHHSAHQTMAIHYTADPSALGQNGMAAAAQLMPVSMAGYGRQPGGYPTANQQMHAAAAASYGQAAAAAAAAYQSHQQQQNQQSGQQPRTGGGPYGPGSGQVGTYGQQAALAAAAAAGYQTRPFTANSPAAHIQQGAASAAGASYPGTLQGSSAGHPAGSWITHHPGPHPGTAYHLIQSPTGHLQPGMIPSQTLQALHLSALMPQLSAQMSQLQLSGPSVGFLSLCASFFL